MYRSIEMGHPVFKTAYSHCILIFQIGHLQIGIFYYDNCDSDVSLQCINEISEEMYTIHIIYLHTHTRSYHNILSQIM